MFEKKEKKKPKLPLSEELEVNVIIKDLIEKVENPNFKIQYRLSEDNKGYVFWFPDYTERSVVLNASFQEENIHKTTKARDCLVSRTGWAENFYFWVKLIQNYKFNEFNGLNVGLAYVLSKKCCERFNITLEERLDCKLPTSGKSPVQLEIIKEEPAEEEEELLDDEENELSEQQINNESADFIKMRIENDKQFLAAFEKQFNCQGNQSLVLEVFDSLLDYGDNSGLISEINTVWSFLNQPEGEPIVLHLQCIKNYVIKMRHKKARLAWQY